MLVKVWMKDEVITVDPDDSIAKAESLMEAHAVRRIPVVDDGKKLFGIFSREDLKSALPSVVDSSVNETARALAGHVKVRTFMTQNPITVEPSDTLEAVAAIMRKRKIGGIPVTENGVLVGIITESDVFDAFVEMLGGANKDTRIELNIDHKPESLYKIFNFLSENEVQLNNIAISNNHSSQYRKLVFRIQSDEPQAIIDELWSLGCQITSVKGSQ